MQQGKGPLSSCRAYSRYSLHSAAASPRDRQTPPLRARHKPATPPCPSFVISWSQWQEHFPRAIFPEVAEGPRSASGCHGEPGKTICPGWFRLSPPTRLLLKVRCSQTSLPAVRFWGSKLGRGNVKPLKWKWGTPWPKQGKKSSHKRPILVPNTKPTISSCYSHFYWFLFLYSQPISIQRELKQPFAQWATLIMKIFMPGLMNVSVNKERKLGRHTMKNYNSHKILKWKLALSYKFSPGFPWSQRKKLHLYEICIMWKLQTSKKQSPKNSLPSFVGPVPGNLLGLCKMWRASREAWGRLWVKTWETTRLNKVK